MCPCTWVCALDGPPWWGETPRGNPRGQEGVPGETMALAGALGTVPSPSTEPPWESWGGRGFLGTMSVTPHPREATLALPCGRARACCSSLEDVSSPGPSHQHVPPRLGGPAPCPGPAPTAARAQSPPPPPSSQVPRSGLGRVCCALAHTALAGRTRCGGLQASGASPCLGPRCPAACLLPPQSCSAHKGTQSRRGGRVRLLLVCVCVCAREPGHACGHGPHGPHGLGSLPLGLRSPSWPPH